MREADDSRGARPFFTLIIPVHNGAEVIGRTLASVRAQTFSDVQIVVIEDSSTDGTARAVHACGLTPICVRMGSAGGARNVGLSLARGLYTLFLDADDAYPHEGVLARLHATLLTEQFPDILHCGFWYGDQRASVWSAPGRFWPNVWSRAWLTELVRRHWFAEKNYAEDADFLERVFPHARRTAILDEPIVRYTPPQPGSLSWAGGDRPIGHGLTGLGALT